MDSQALTLKVKKFAKSQGADLVGIVGRKSFGGLPMLKPDDLMPNAQSVVVIGVRRNVHTLAPEATWDMMEHYVAGLNLDMYVLLRTTHFLEDSGFKTVPLSHHGYHTPRDEARHKAYEQLDVSAGGNIKGEDKFNATFYASLKTVSHLRLAEACGLGSVGRCKMVVTKEFGPRVGFASVITDAVLVPDEPLKTSTCLGDKCNTCVKQCPAQALDVDNPSLLKCMLKTGAVPPLRWRANGEQDKITQYFRNMRKSVFPFEEAEVFQGSTAADEESPGCGLCIRICPVGKK